MNSKQKPLPTCRTIETTINRNIIVDQLSAFLYAASIINDDENILDITFGDINQDRVPITLHFKKKQNLETIKL